MIWADYAILGIIGLSALLSILRGFVREILSLVAWVLAFWVALTFMHHLAGYLTEIVPVPSVRLVSAFLMLFLGTLLIMGVVNYVIGKVVAATGLSGTDRMLGIFFGIVRGILIVAVLVFVAGLTSLPRDPWWRESLLIKYFEPIALWIRGLLPEEAASYLQSLKDKPAPQPPSEPRVSP
jgi:membrane protein required for colicin V production